MDQGQSGRIVYDPPRGPMRNTTQWWAVVDVDIEITRCYRWWVKQGLGIDLHKPAWDAHISAIRGEKPPVGLEHPWKKYHGQKVDFVYHHNPRQSGDITGFDRPDHFLVR